MGSVESLSLGYTLIQYSAMTERKSKVYIECDQCNQLCVVSAMGHGKCSLRWCATVSVVSEWPLVVRTGSAWTGFETQSLPSRVKLNIPIEWRDLCKLVHNYCDPTFASYFRMKTQTFQVKNNPLLTPRLCYDLTLLFLLGVLGLSLLLITVVVLWYCNIYHYIIRGA